MGDLKQRLRRQAQAFFMRARPVYESVCQIRVGDPAANRFASFGRGSRIDAPQVGIMNPGNVSIGTNTYLRSYLAIEAYPPVPNEVVIEVGDDVQLGHFVRLAAFNGIVIEDLVGIGHGCTIADSVHDWKGAEADGRALWNTPAKLGRGLRIGRGAWIGNNTVVAGGVTIGEWAIVEANSVVSRDVPARSVVGGSPVRVLRVRSEEGGWKALADPPLLQDYDATITSDGSR